MKGRTLLIAAVLLQGLTDCRKADIPDYDLNTYSILWKESSAWVNFSYNATITQDGKLDVREKHELSNKFRESKFTIPTEDLSLIKEKLKDLVQIEISDKYGFHDNAATDAPTTKIRYITTNKSDSTYLYYPNEHELPDKLEIFLQVVQQVISRADTLRN